jgi:hypothetical protein
VDIGQVDGAVKPIRIGVYETLPEDGSKASFQHWDGKQWGFCAMSPEYALIGIGAASHYQSPKWRGLTKDPSAAKETSHDMKGSRDE